jgi:hypothetical protein
MFPLLKCLLYYNIDTNLKEVGFQVSMVALRGSYESSDSTVTQNSLKFRGLIYFV